jgi:uncharacterized membrane protein
MVFRAIIPALLAIVAGITAVFFNAADSQESKLQVVPGEFQGLRFEQFQNSASYSQAIAINSQGNILGFKEVPNREGTIFSNVYFFVDKTNHDMPVPKGYTNSEAAAVSDTGLVVGHVTRPIRSEGGSLRAVLWNPAKDSVDLLPLPEDDLVADAQDISADGKLITGYSTGPERLRPAIWVWQEQAQNWKVEVLPTIHQMNPYLMSAQLVISPDGKTIVGCCTEKFGPGGSVDSALYKWQLREGQWERTLITTEQLYVKAINNRGQIVGSITGGSSGRMPCLLSPEGQITTLELLEGDASGEARDINEEAVIVGWSDDPHGPEGGPVPCQWNVEGKVTQLILSTESFGMANGINNAGQIAGTAEFKLPSEEKTKNEDDAEPKIIMLAFRTLPAAPSKASEKK